MTLLTSNKKLKILIIQLRQLGDVILTTPLARQVRKIYPNAEIHFLTEKLGSHVYKYNKNVDELIVIPNKMNVFQLLKTYLQIRKQKYDIVIDCFSNPKSSQFTFFSGAAQRIGFAFSGRKFAYNKLIPPHYNNEYSAITKLQLISHLGADLTDHSSELPITDELKQYAINFANQYLKEKNVIAFNVVSRRDYKIWDSNNYVTLANKLIENGFSLLFVYGPGEYDLAKIVYDGIERKSEAILDYPIPNVLELRAILEHCKIYIGNDGGIKHLAVCANIPTLTIFQNIHWKNWTPPHSSKHVAITNCLEDKNFCDNCVDKNRCYINLNAEKVFEIFTDVRIHS